MGWKRCVILDCDNCGMHFSCDGIDFVDIDAMSTVASARKHAATFGWSYSHEHGDRCVECMDRNQ